MKIKSNISCLFMISFLFLSHNVKAQKKGFFNKYPHEIGFIVGYGDEKIFNVEYKYRLYFFLAQYNIPIFRKGNWSIDNLIQPQYNKTILRKINTNDKETSSFEFGVNMGFVFRYFFLNQKMSIYFLISSGPHYVDETPSRQANGFIFSDNANFGLTFNLTDKIYVDLRPGIRHISNLNIEQPNGGVNSAVIHFGFLAILN